MFEKLVWAAWGWSTGASFRVGMWFVRLSSYRLCRSYNSVDSGRWSIDHWSRESGRLSVEDRAQYSEFVRSFLLSFLWGFSCLSLLLSLLFPCLCV